MRFHVVSLPHTQTTEEYSACAYTQKVRRFATMMYELGHEVFLYSGEENTAKCTEHIPCITKESQAAYGCCGPSDYLVAQLDPKWGLYEEFNANIVREIQDRIKQKDFICLITSYPNNPVFENFSFPEYQVVEFGIGYEGTVSQYRVFESHGWRNYVHGLYKENSARVFDAVIPNYYDPTEYPLGTGKRDYFLFAGRLIERKGFQLAADVCQRLNVPLKVIGLGEPPAYGEYLGLAGPELRSELMAGAKALFVPTYYLGPFEGVHAEAQLCGTPVITTNFGIFTETVTNGFNGFRCDTFDDFAQVAQKIWNGEWVADHEAIRANAISQWSMDVVGKQYEDYFKRLLLLWEDGFYAGWGPPTA